MKPSIDAYPHYKARLEKHISAVQEFGRKLGVPAGQLAAHDASKWSEEEYEPYAKFFSKDGPRVDDMRLRNDFITAWLHHLHFNSHHWQHWMFPDGYSPRGSVLENGVMPMPQMYALEMIADWHGAGFTYQGSWDISGWLEQNMQSITLHSTTAVYVEFILEERGYQDTVCNNHWKHELA